MSSVSNPETAPSPNDSSEKKLPRFVQYYLKQGVFPEDQLKSILATLEAPLPSCFRVNPNAADADSIKERLAGYFQLKFDGASWQGTPVTPPRELAWYPFRQSAWQLDGGKNALGKAARDHDGVREFREWLLYETSTGNLTRQEAVSMIPAMLLGIKREHLVLDLCAAPGSKTSQVMEHLGQPSGASFDAEFEAKSGFIVANDANEKRGYMLVHQLQRMGLDTAVVTCHLGQDFPGLYVDGALQKTDVFDRVICDVPCTGDGTIRKNKNIWGTWLPGGALTLHQVQLELGLRAAALLKNDGLMVYSTCSFNPVENEAIVAEMLRRADGALEIVDASHLLPGLVRRPGMTDWQVAWLSKVARAELEWFASYDDVPKTLKGFRISKSMYPPEDESIRASLRHCVRLFPTDQNTGGFFVTLLRKTRALPGELQTGLSSYEASRPRRPHPEMGDFKCKICNDPSHTIRNCPESWNGKRIAREKEEKHKKMKEELANAPPPAPLHGYTKLAPAFRVVIKVFYGIKDGFPHEHLCSRSDRATSVCLVNKNLQDACLVGTHLRVLNTGVRCFAKVAYGEVPVFRPTEEGMGFVLPFMTKRKINATLTDLQQLLACRVGGAITMESFSPALQQDSSALETLSGVGPVVLVLSPPPQSTEQMPFALPVWLGSKSLGPLIDKGAQKQLQEVLARFTI